jgi:PhnB protein
VFALHLLAQDVPASIEWYERALGASLSRLLRLPNGTVAIADLHVGDLPVALAAPIAGTAMAVPNDTSSTVAAFRLTVPNADLAVTRALDAGAVLVSPTEDKLWGVRSGEVLDPSGHRWGFDQHLRDVPDADIEAQLAAIIASH